MNKISLKHSANASLGLPCTLVTGATSGVGYALVQQLAEAGVKVLALGRNSNCLAELTARYPQVVGITADLADLDSLPSLISTLLREHPDLAGLINNAGIQYDLRVDAADYGGANIRQEIEVNLLAPLLLSHGLLAHFQRQPAAFIVNVSSGLAHVPKRTAAVYSASKAGLHLFSQALRVQLHGSSVRVIEAVLPLVDTPMTSGRGSGKVSAAQAARGLIDGLLAGQQDIWVGKARLLPILQRQAPGLLARIMQRS